MHFQYFDQFDIATVVDDQQFVRWLEICLGETRLFLFLSRWLEICLGDARLFWFLSHAIMLFLSSLVSSLGIVTDNRIFDIIDTFTFNTQTVDRNKLITNWNSFYILLAIITQWDEFPHLSTAKPNVYNSCFFPVDKIFLLKQHQNISSFLLL